MNLLAVGVSHNSAPVRTLEQVAIGADDLGKVHEELLACEQLCEVFVVSTCNRVEVYAVAETFHGGLDDVSGVLARHAGAEVSELADELYVFYAGAAVEHLFSVAAGLDSMVIGEAQILGQLRHAYSIADELGTVGKALHELAQQALRVGKRVHAETDIDSAGASVVSEALADAERELGAIEGRRALLVGAGAMGGLAAAALRRAGIGEVVIANRTAENGQRLVDSLQDEGVSAQVAGLDQLEPAVAASDLVVSCTGAVDAVITRPVVDNALAERGTDDQGRPNPLVLCDLGLPRDTAPDVPGLDRVTVVDLETLRERLSAGGGTSGEHAEEIVDEEVRHYLAAQRSAEVTPTVTALRKRAAEVVDTELMQLDSRLPELDDDVRGELTRTVRRVVDKLLHTPTVRVKQLAAVPGGTGYADALRELFELDPQTTAAIASTKAAATPDAPEGRTSVSRAGRRSDLPQQDGEDR